jgi:membrane fusion protein (multidrug efflux system)
VVPTAFTKTLRALDQGRPVTAVVRFAVALGILGALGWWMARVPVALFETTSTARLEIDVSTTVVQAAITGKVVQAEIPLGKSVRAGDVLVRLDAVPEQLQKRQEETRMSALKPEIDGLNAQIAADEAAGADERRASQSAIEEAKLRIREMETQLRQAQVERRRYEQLTKEGLAPASERDRTSAEAERLEHSSATLRSGIERLEREQKTRDSQREVRVAEVRTQIARLESGRAGIEASIRRVNYDVQRRVITAPVDGVIGEAAVLRPGSVLQEGARVVSIVPAGRLRIVAFFSPEAAYGRIRRGARARLRLKGYPWTEFGVVEARVTETGGEDRDGRTRVELQVLPSPTLRTTLHHGMPGDLEVEVERATPLSLVMRTAGQWLKSAAGGTP